MKTSGFGLYAVLVAAGLSSQSMQANAQEQDLCQFQRSPEQGLGGTGIASTDVLSRLTSIIAVEQGIGGSGYTDDLERGLGGTGVIASNERGLGGTGIIGVVTGFASICVNGYEVHVDNQTSISIEGFTASDADLQLGQLVAVEAYTVDGALVASSVQVQVAVAGPVESVDSDVSTLTVAGQTLLASGFGGSADISDVAPGDWVVASGLRRADDTVAASSIVPLERAGEVIVVSGPVRETDSGAVRIGELALTSDSLSPGQEIVARGTLENGQLTPDTVSVRPRLPFTSGVETFSVQGFPAIGANGVPQVGGVSLADSQPPPGQQPVQVEGTVTPDGQVVPSDTFAPPPPQNGALPKPPPSSLKPDGSKSGGQEGGKGGGQQSNPSPPLPNPGNGQGANQGGNNQSQAPQPSPEVPQTGSAAQGAAPAERSATPERSSSPNRPEQVDRPARPEQPARPERPARPDRVDRPDRPERPERVDRPARPDRPTRPR